MQSFRKRAAWCVLTMATVASCGGVAEHEHLEDESALAVASCPEHGCRVVARTSLSRAELAQILSVPDDGVDLDDVVAYRTGDAISLLPGPRKTRPGSFVRISDGGALTGASLAGIYADSFMVAGKTPAEQLIALQGGTRGAWVAVIDQAKRQLGPSQSINQDVNHFAQTAQAASAPSLDGLRSAFAIGNTIIGPIDVGVVGADAALAGPVTRICKADQNCACLSVVPTHEAGAISLVEDTLGQSGTERHWRVVTLDAKGKVLHDSSVPLASSAACPLVVQSQDGPIALVRGMSGDELLSFDSPQHPKRITASSDHRGPIVGLAVSGRDALLVQYGETPSVVRATDGVVDEASRLPLRGARGDVSVVSSNNGLTVLHYGTDTSQEIVSISCR